MSARTGSLQIWSWNSSVLRFFEMVKHVVSIPRRTLGATHGSNSGSDGPSSSDACADIAFAFPSLETQEPKRWPVASPSPRHGHHHCASRHTPLPFVSSQPPGRSAPFNVFQSAHAKCAIRCCPEKRVDGVAAAAVGAFGKEVDVEGRRRVWCGDGVSSRCSRRVRKRGGCGGRRLVWCGDGVWGRCRCRDSRVCCSRGLQDCGGWRSR